MGRFAESELMLNADGTIYHLNLLPGEVAPTVILVGDPDRVAMVSQRFDTIEVRKQKREFVTHTGNIGINRVSVVSTGIGPDNIDIVVNELDALVNIDFQSRQAKSNLTSLRLVRLGTSGALQPDIPVDSFVVSEWALGLDGLMRFYRHRAEWPIGLREFCHQLPQASAFAYAAGASADLLGLVPSNWRRGITVTCPGFYGPQGRTLRASLVSEDWINRLRDYPGNPRITNFEMETSAIYALGKLLGHECLSISTIVANRLTGESSRRSQVAIQEMIDKVIPLL
jgi:uridine phosphorylase